MEEVLLSQRIRSSAILARGNCVFRSELGNPLERRKRRPLLAAAKRCVSADACAVIGGGRCRRLLFPPGMAGGSIGLLVAGRADEALGNGGDPPGNLFDLGGHWLYSCQDRVEARTDCRKLSVDASGALAARPHFQDQFHNGVTKALVFRCDASEILDRWVEYRRSNTVVFGSETRVFGAKVRDYIIWLVGMYDPNKARRVTVGLDGSGRPCGLKFLYLILELANPVSYRSLREAGPCGRCRYGEACFDFCAKRNLVIVAHRRGSSHQSCVPLSLQVSEVTTLFRKFGKTKQTLLFQKKVWYMLLLSLPVLQAGRGN